MNTWRLIPLMQASGDVQMAIDAWLLEQHRLGAHPPTLRFYTWSPVTLSLGYHQRRYPDFWNTLTWRDNSSANSPTKSIDIVRRPSGGRAVLHQGDLTYAVITSGLFGNRMQAYQQICEFLIQGWRALGIDLHYGQAGRGYIHYPNCFGTATGADLVTPEGAKLIGSAQLRKDAAILQHGSMCLEPDGDLFKYVFQEELRVPKLDLAMTGDTLIKAVMNGLIDAAIAHFNLALVEQPLTDSEWQQINATKQNFTRQNFFVQNHDAFSNVN